MRLHFYIQSKEFFSEAGCTGNVIQVSSCPRNYTVFLIHNEYDFDWLYRELEKENHPLLLIDEKIKTQIITGLDYSKFATYAFAAIEQNKNIDTVLKVCDFLLENNANRGSVLYVIGGGIVQDIGAFSAYMYKRGIPWKFVPTTLLAQSDSCVGGKTAVNYKATKNVLGLFSAPRQVFIDTAFINTISDNDFYSGCGEIFRLCLTGGESSIEFLEKHIDTLIQRNMQAINECISCSLEIKKLIVTEDEFELDLRRSMNYGHSIGHAIEALSNFLIPHGIAVSIGILVENAISTKLGLLSEKEFKRLYVLGKKIIPDIIWQYFIDLKCDTILPILANDKKVEGKNLKLAVLTKIGHLEFIDVPLDSTGLRYINDAFFKVKDLW